MSPTTCKSRRSRCDLSAPHAAGIKAAATQQDPQRAGLQPLTTAMAFIPRSLVALALTALAVAQTTLTGQYSCYTDGNYELCNDQWGIDEGTGNQTATFIGLVDGGDAVSWSTTYTWADNENDVKTYANILTVNAYGQALSDISEATTAWSWYYESQSSGLRADVSYDIWTGTNDATAPPTSTTDYEIMIWLSGLGGIQPVGSSIVTGISLEGYDWDLWYGPNSGWDTYSFIPATSGDSITDFSASLVPFFTYLSDNGYVAETQVLQAVQTGTEAFTGSAELVTSSFSLTVTFD
ncbi:uncharacterized protein FIBRA_03723 [Fibroporia radiculosa]|uniref:Uncharacterized protein n=1 Tax=Fibroporia radiculosa TaxID=599839 RepID=J4I9S3_9APHY|nr:uncharacterized protein FIBRA_03723 [Fibroporia radiculosa]CCM01661.1 predicted protein [Fibroporia radiculosa]